MEIHAGVRKKGKADWPMEKKNRICNYSDFQVKLRMRLAILRLQAQKQLFL